MKLLKPAAFFSSLMLALSVQAETIYQTDFPDTIYTIPTDWSVVQGATGDETTSGFRIDGGGDFRYDAASSNGLALYVGSVTAGYTTSALGDFTISSAIRKSSSGATGIVARSNLAGDSFYTVRMFNSSALQIYRFDSGSPTLLGQASFSGGNYVVGETWTVVASFEGNTISAEVFNDSGASAATLEVTDSTYSSGYVGVRGQITSLWEDFAVTSIPEPATFAMILGVGGLGVAMVRRRRK
ncbi:PEP-CTERM sorting domain-containing protein [Coraliomargarita parva]|uniref:PEP-CTERM sorting domain-containing protein n=1 Tax=Coraliomargarita parva TaxID=3014050 RepID=UPI0022B40DE6|nr:PEP-CTERM sorting domain-containing protein [Coraliomargarita parva]